MGADTANGTWVRRSVLADQVYTEILARLMDGKLESGDPLSIDGTARDLGVSPTPVREALARLEATGMVVRAALRGYRVAPMLSHAELLDLMEARLLIEPRNAELACLHANEAFLSELEYSIEDLRQAPNGPHFSDYRSYWEADERFHRLIAEQTGNRFLLGAYNSWVDTSTGSACLAGPECATPAAPSRSTAWWWLPCAGEMRRRRRQP